MDFQNYLKIQTEHYEGDYDYLITRAPVIYKCLYDILSEEILEKNDRKLILTTIGYFFIPKDVFSEEEHGAIGFIDDLLLSIHVFLLLKERYGNEVIDNYWNEQSCTFEELITQYQEVVRAEYDMYQEVLEFAGIE